MVSQRLIVGLAFMVLLNSMQISSHDYCPKCEEKLHPQEAFCRDDFVIRAIVTDEMEIADNPTTTEDESKTIYSIDIVKVFKEPEIPSIQATCIVTSLTGNDTIACFFTLHAPAVPMLCEVDLEVGTEYLLSGTVEDGKLIIDRCNLAIPWDEVTSHMKIGLNRRYEKNCGCEVGEEHCIIGDKPIDICFCQFATCVEVKKKGCAPVCKWKKSKTFKECVKEQEMA